MIADAIRVSALPKDCPYAADAGETYVGQQPLPSDWTTVDALRLLGRDLGVDEDTIDTALRGDFDIGSISINKCGGHYDKRRSHL